MTLTQRERVLQALKHAGPTGLTQVDFFAPAVVDHGKPITRLAARINELRDQGYAITSSGTRHGCAVYRLVSDGSARDQGSIGHASGGTPAGPSESALFDASGLHTISPYDPMADAA